MRLVTWNCRVGAFRGKSQFIARLKPDVLVAQEVERLDDILLFEGVQPTFRDRLTDPRYPRRGIGVFSYTATQIEAVDTESPAYAFRRYLVSHGGLVFNLAGFWTWKTDDPETAYRQVHEGLIRHADWVRARPTVLLGDLNTNAGFRGSLWPDLEELLERYGLASAYHSSTDEAAGHEQRATYFHRGNRDQSFHIDYCFIPKDWCSYANAVVGDYDEWHSLSDHVPLIVDVDVDGLLQSASFQAGTLRSEGGPAGA